MTITTAPLSCAQWLVKALAARGIDTVFGIPGVHTIALCRGLEGSNIRHVTPRHEQGAGFMADGYARASGRPGVCFIITGPGMTNIATAMGQAYADSVPMLVISSVNRQRELGMGEGRLHELPSQRHLIAGVCAFSHTLLDIDTLPAVLDRAFAVFVSSRPRPVHIEIPLDLFDAEMSLPLPGPTPRLYRAPPAPEGITFAIEWLISAERPLLMLGGGTVDAPEAARALAERLDAPAITTINAKGVLGRDHPLDLGANAALPAVRDYAASADVILAIGTEIGETDYDVVFDGGFRLTGRLIRIDIDAAQLTSNQRPALGLIADAGAAMRALVEKLAPMQRDGAGTVQRIRRTLALDEQPQLAPFVSFFAAIDAALPDATLVGDSTAPVYAGNHLVSRAEVRHWFNASTGYGTLGYGLPAAIGVGLARPDAPVVALVGDGGVMFTLAELAAAVHERVAITLIIWNNHGYDEIRRAMDARNVVRLGVDLPPPDFEKLAAGFGCPYRRVGSASALTQALCGPREAGRPLLIEVDATRWEC